MKKEKLIDEENSNEEEFLLNLSKICEDVIINPQNIQKISQLILLSNRDPTILMSILKVFLNTAPLYKIKIINDQIKHKKEYLKLQKYDKEYLEVYSKFIHKIVKGTDFSSYKCSSLILRQLSHFNFIEKIIVHVLEGTRSEDLATQQICLDALEHSILNDHEGYLVSKIVQQMNTFGFGKKVLSLLIKIPFINIFLNEKEYNQKLKFIKEERMKKHKELTRKEDELSKNKKLKTNSSRSAKKIDKENKKKISKISSEEGKISFEQMDKNYQQIVNALHRIYLFVLRDKLEDFYFFTFCGLLKYKNLIKNELFDGLNVLLKNLIKEKMEFKTKMILFNLILVLNERKSFDLENVIISFLDSLKKNIKNIKREKEDNCAYKSICAIIKFNFINKKQSEERINKLLKILLLICSIQYLPEVSHFITELIEVYDVDLQDNEIEDSFFEYDLYEKINLYKK